MTNWTVLDVSIEIRAAPSKANRILADKATRTRVVVSGAIVIQAGFGIEFPTSVAEAVQDRAG